MSTICRLLSARRFGGLDRWPAIFTLKLGSVDLSSYARMSPDDRLAPRVVLAGRGQPFSEAVKSTAPASAPEYGLVPGPQLRSARVDEFLTVDEVAALLMSVISRPYQVQKRIQPLV